MFIYGVLAIPAYIHAKRRQALFWIDTILPVLVVLFWFIITASGHGHQSLSNFIEAPIALLFSLILLNIRVFITDQSYKNYRKNSYVTMAISLLFVFLLRSFMPFIPE